MSDYRRGPEHIISTAGKRGVRAQATLSTWTGRDGQPRESVSIGLTPVYWGRVNGVECWRPASNKITAAQAARTAPDAPHGRYTPVLFLDLADAGAMCEAIMTCASEAAALQHSEDDPPPQDTGGDDDCPF